MRVFIRAALTLLFLDELLVGGWNAVSPETFYRLFPTVSLTPPFSEHYARDFGGATLGLALLLGLAAARPRPRYVVPASLAFLIFAAPHFFFHLAHLQGMTPGQAIGLTMANGAVALLAVAVLTVVIVNGAPSALPAEPKTSA